NSKPIIFDFVNNFQSIRAGDFLNDLQEAGETERELREEFGLSTDYLPDIHVHDESRAILKTFQEIDERLGSWEINFQKLVSYKEEYGDCRVTRSGGYTQLAYWVSKQRYNKQTLRVERIKLLNEIGFIWEPDKEAWENGFKKLLAHKKEYGHCFVTPSHGDKQLKSWVQQQRSRFTTGNLDADRIKRLDEIGFVWNVIEEAWENNFQRLVAYKREYGDCLVPRESKANKQLGIWVGKQRSHRHQLDDKQIKRLDELGFVWEIKQHRWELQFESLTAYQKKHGDCLVPIRRKSDKQLAYWVGKQRSHRHQLDDKQIKRLDELGFVWNVDEYEWELQFNKMVAYKKEHGDCLVPRKYKQDQKFSSWVAQQRYANKKGKLNSQRKKLLEELNFNWDPKGQAWELQFQALLAYKEEYQDCLIPYSWEDRKLAYWVSAQRQNNKKGTLSADKIKRLDEIGFVWDTTK
ncbi:helicase associated domain-containing protein, partial [Akkermansiaceae bacterium]|nr:helicase associated domain-containing protein [Akkermansiaceae bacterium]